MKNGSINIRDTGRILKKNIYNNIVGSLIDILRKFGFPSYPRNQDGGGGLVFNSRGRTE